MASPLRAVSTAASEVFIAPGTVLPARKSTLSASLSGCCPPRFLWRLPNDSCNLGCPSVESRDGAQFCHLRRPATSEALMAPGAAVGTIERPAPPLAGKPSCSEKDIVLRALGRPFRSHFVSAPCESSAPSNLHAAAVLPSAPDSTDQTQMGAHRAPAQAGILYSSVCLSDDEKMIARLSLLLLCVCLRPVSVVVRRGLSLSSCRLLSVVSSSFSRLPSSRSWLSWLHRLPTFSSPFLRHGRRGLSSCLR